MTRSDEHAGLRRVAALVGSAELEAVIAAATEELAHVVELARVVRYAGDGTFTVLGSSGEHSRVDDPGVTVPIIVDGVRWGAISVHGRSPLPADIEAFAGVLAAAVASAGAQIAARRLAEERSAMRRVTALIRREVPLQELFAAVVEEVGRLLDADATSLVRDDAAGGRETVLAFWARPGLVRDDLGVSRSLGVPIIVNQRVWGSLLAHTTGAPLPADAEERLLSFAELTATTIVEARCAASPTSRPRCGASRRSSRASRPREDVFPVVVEELGRVLGFDYTRLLRYRDDGTVEHVVSWPRRGHGPPARCPARRRQRDRARQAHLAPRADR